MKITKIEIKNFRNLKYIVLDFKLGCNIITGANGIGKSNTLNANHWTITNTLLTDKWSVGENDLDSIVPITFKKGEHTEVTITFEDGTTFTKMLKTKPSGGHYTDYLVNGAGGYTQSSFNEALFVKFNFTPKLRCKKEVDELRVMVDPLYALQKIDAKALRLLLCDLGCSVTNDDVFNLFEEYLPLRAYESKYLGDYTLMRKNLKAERIELNKQIESLEITLSQYQDVEEYTTEHRESLEAKKDDLVVKIRNLRKGDSNLTNEIDLKLQKANSDKELFIAERKAEISQKLALLNQELKLAQMEANESKNKRLQVLNENLRAKITTRNSLTTSIGAYLSTREEKRKQVIDIKSRIENYTARIEDNKNAYDDISKREFKGYVTCPDCGKIFAADEASLLLFNKQKQDDLERIKNESSRLEIEIVELQKSFETNATLGRNAKEQQEDAENKLKNLNEEIENINNEILAVSSQSVDLSKVNEIQNKIDNLDQSINTEMYDSVIQDLENKKDDILINQAQANQNEIELLENQLQPIKDEIETEYMKQSKYNSKLEFEAKYSATQEKLNDTESLLELVNSFIQKKISLINAKAKELTGIDFVMLEENLTNDNVKEVCYATVNGVEFSNVNTSQKLEVEIQFIHRIKQILGANDLPILADRLEGFDDIEKIRNLTTEQLICTVVGNKEQKEIVII